MSQAGFASPGRKSGWLRCGTHTGAQVVLEAQPGRCGITGAPSKVIQRFHDHTSHGAVNVSNLSIYLNAPSPFERRSLKARYWLAVISSAVRPSACTRAYIQDPGRGRSATAMLRGVCVDEHM